MKRIKDNLILFQLAIILIVAGGYLLLKVNSFEDFESNLIGGIIMFFIGCFIMWRSFIRNNNKE